MAPPAAPRLRAYWDERFARYDFGPGHPFRTEFRGLAASLVRRARPDASTLRWVDHVEPMAASELRRFHTAEYLERIREAGGRADPVSLDGDDTPSFPGCFEASARIARATVEAVEATLEEGVPSWQPAGGLHHAHPDRASGFCLFNDLALGLLSARRRRRRVAYVDLDAHHGDGVMYGFYTDGGLLAIDFHQDGRTLFPGTGSPGEIGRGDGEGSKINLPLRPGAGDRALLGLFRRVALPALERFRPELVVLQHGMDGHVGDPLANLRYTYDGYRTLLRELQQFVARRASGRLVITGGGGYDPAAVAVGLSAAALAASAPTWSPTEPVPRGWAAEFERIVGRPSPTDWAERTGPPAEAWDEQGEETLVRSLEAALGVRFPPSS